MSLEDRIIKPAEAAALLGVTVATLNNWDDKLKPFRTPGNQRRYSLAHIQQIKNGQPKRGTKEHLQQRMEQIYTEMAADIEKRGIRAR